MVQNIIHILRNNADSLLRGGTFGWTDTHVQIMIVDTQLQIMLKRLRFELVEDVCAEACSRIGTGVACVPY
jgi:hypothetical protein